MLKAKFDTGDCEVGWLRPQLMGCSQSTNLSESDMGSAGSGSRKDGKLSDLERTGALTFKDLVSKIVEKKLRKARHGRNSTFEAKLKRITGVVERRIVHSYVGTKFWLIIQND